MNRFTSLLGVLISSLTTLSAQEGIGSLYAANLPGDADLPPGAVNITDIVEAATGGVHPFFSGVIRMPNGRYLISATSDVWPGVSHKYFEFNSDGSYLATYDQPANTAANQWGMNDMAWDGEAGPDSRIWAGYAGSGINSFDWQNGVNDPIVSPGSPNGLRILSGYQGNWVQCAAIAEVDGVKIFVSSDFGNPNPHQSPPAPGHPVNYHQMPSFSSDLAQWQAPTPDISPPDLVAISGENTGKWGAAFDPQRGTVWWHMDLATATPNANGNRTRFMEMDMSGQLTGQVYQGDRDIAGRAWGCEMYINDDGELIMVYLVSDATGTGTAEVSMVEVYGGFQYGSSCGGSISYEQEPFIGNSTWTIKLDGAPDNSLNSAILFRGGVAPTPVSFPGVINCPSLINLGNFRNLGVFALNGGSSSYLQPIPDDAGFIGLDVAFQWLLPSGPDVLPLDLSDAGVARIGSNF
ncbi:MAG: hypothetical protein ACYTG5_11460 [Planctomycetota bacterium]|jgi:hypothetical protein